MPPVEDARLPCDNPSPRADEAALTTISGYAGPIVVDLDETLYLRNTTEDFLDTAVPGLAAVLVLRTLEVLQPWRLTGHDTRDVWRVSAILLLMPWTLLLWRRRAPVLAAAVNTPLRDVIADADDRTVIATLGFGPVVRPLIACFGLDRARVVAMRPFRFADRRRGKLALVLGAIGPAALGRALVVTDSPDDRALLEAARVPLLVRWPGARWQRALRRVYLPGQYLSRVKRPGAQYVRRMILPEDFAFWVLSSVFIAPDPIAHVVGLALLLLSLWTIYERGYVDNDRAAARYEADPRLTAEFHDHDVATPRVTPWVWAAASGLAGLSALAWPAWPSPLAIATWGGVLVGLALLYAIYNRVDKPTRIWLFTPLHLIRVAAFAAIVPVTLAGAAALFANVAARWLPYFHYRTAGDATWRIPIKLLRLNFFVFAVIPLFAAGGSGVADLSLAALLAWNLVRARSELIAAMRSASRIDRRKPPQ
jgi:hypothetical protein